MNFNLRSVKKSSLRFIQYFLLKTQYLDPVWDDTYFVNLLKDYWTTANPFVPLTVATLSDAIGIYHANPELYYIPKQKALGNYNDEYGENLYYIEEQISDKLTDVKSFGNHDKIIGSSKLIQNLQRKDRAYVDQSLYIRTRLFDNILGDFDRHSEQWRWAEDKYDDSTFIYSPIRTAFQIGKELKNALILFRFLSLKPLPNSRDSWFAKFLSICFP